jgi:hypothetical protein
MFSARMRTSKPAQVVVLSTDTWNKYVSVLLHGDGTNNQANSTFVDSSANALTITPTGTPTQGSFSPFGTDWGVSFNGITDVLQAPSSSAFGYGIGDLTIEFWINLSRNATGTRQTILDLRQSNSGTPFTIQTETTGQLYMYDGGAGFKTSSTIPSINTWHHVAFSRLSGACKLFFNGTQILSFTNSNDWRATNPVTIGRNASAGIEFLQGYISNLRIVKGTAVYTANFTVPTSNLTAIAGTSLLTCQSNRFVDNSTNNLALTVTGTPKVVKQSPFKTNTYDPVVDGGSIKLTNSGDYFTLNSSAPALGSGDFTIDLWVYVTSYAGNVGELLAYGPNGGNGAYPALGVNGNGTIRFDAASPIGGGIITGSVVPLNTWNHVAVSRSVSNTKLFLNGVLQGSCSDSTNYISSTNRPIIGQSSYAQNSSVQFFGYISNLRILKGTALYTSNFTVPTAPLTAITNTQLLLSGTNAGITDNSKLQNWTTYGNAKITTSDKKFGTGSIKLDAGGSLTTPITNPPQINMTAGASWTIEMWVCRTGTHTATSNPLGVGEYSITAVIMGWSFGISSTGIPQFYWYNGSLNYCSATTITALNTWYHISCVCTNGILRVFVNGISEGSSSTLSAPSATGLTYITIGMWAGGVTCPLLIDDLRITNGVARYTGNFTPAVNPNISLDPLSPYNVLQLNADDTGTGTFIDSSVNALTVTKTGTPTQGSFSPFGDQWSTSFDAAGSMLTIPSNNILNFGTGDFTVECWVKLSSYNGLNMVIDNNGGTGLAANLIVNRTTNGDVSFYNGNTAKITYSAGMLLGVWYHIAVSRLGTTLTMFINGSQVSSITDSSNYPVGHTNSYVSNATYTLKGSVSNIRVVKGTAVYTSNFTPPTSNLTAIAGTSLLTCQSNRFIDNSTNNFPLTVTGTPQITNQSPFPKVEYIPATHGGSIYFNGTSDYLTLPSLTIGTNSFTIETLVYSTSNNDYQMIVSSGSTGQLRMFASYTTGNIYVFSGTGTVLTGTTGKLKINTWNHIALVRNGLGTNNLSLYVNGILDVFTTFTTNITSIPYFVGYESGIFKWFGYMSSMRITYTALYTSNFTVPTAPLTAITNTQLLLSGTNAQLVDKSRTSNLILNGTATVSTSQFKYGASSMKFDGSVGVGVSYLDSPSVRFGASDFTVELWAYITAWPTNSQALCQLNAQPSSPNYSGFYLGINTSRRVFFNVSTASNSWTFDGTSTSTNTVISLNTWNHFSVSRTGTLVSLYVNGVFVFSTTISGSLFAGVANKIGNGTNTGINESLNGYIDDFRLTIGKSRPVFAVPTEAFPNV